MQIDLILAEKAPCLEEHGYFLLLYRHFLNFISGGFFALCTFIRDLFLLYSVSVLAPCSLYWMAHLVEGPLALKLEQDNDKKKKNADFCTTFKNPPSLILCSHQKMFTPLPMLAFLL